MKISMLFADAPTAIGFVDEARRFAESHDANIERWRKRCPSGAWLLWAAGTCGVPSMDVVAGACKCARQALKYLPADELRPQAAIEVAERWVGQRATMEDCVAIGDTIAKVQDEIGRQCSDAEINIASAMLAAGAAAMPANAARYSSDQRWCSHFAAQTVQMAAGAARHAEGDDAMWRMHNECADLVRDILPAFRLPEPL